MSEQNSGLSIFDKIPQPSEPVIPETPPPASATPEPIVPATPPIPPPFDPAAFAKTLGESVVAALPKPVVPEPKQLSPEEAKKLLKVWEPTDEFLAKFDNLETRKDALREMVQGIYVQADTAAQIRLIQMQQGIAQEVQQRMTPVEQYFAQEAVRQRENHFQTKFPELAKPELRPLLTGVMAGMAAAGQLDWNKSEETITAVASNMEKTIQQYNPTFKLSGGTVVAPTPSGSTPVKPATSTNPNALPSTTSGSGGGGGGVTPAGANAKKGLSIWDK